MFIKQLQIKKTNWVVSVLIWREILREISWLSPFVHWMCREAVMIRALLYSKMWLVRGMFLFSSFLVPAGVVCVVWDLWWFLFLCPRQPSSYRGLTVQREVTWIALLFSFKTGYFPCWNSIDNFHVYLCIFQHNLFYH